MGTSNTKENIGDQLRQAREVAGFSSEDVANELRLTVTIVNHIEANKFEAVAPTFMRGYIRSYAKLVQIPDTHITEALVECGLTETNHRNPSPMPEDTTGKSSSINKLKIGIYVAIVALLIALSFTWHHHNFATPNTTTPKASDSPAQVEANALTATETIPSPTTLNKSPIKEGITQAPTNATIAAALPEQGVPGATTKGTERE